MDFKHQAEELLSKLMSNTSNREELTDYERLGIAAGGALLTIIGIKRFRNSKGLGITLATLGGGMLASAINGKNPAYALNKPGSNEVKAKATCTIKNRSRDEVYDFWRNLENLPSFMEHLEEVNETSKKRSHWKAGMLGIGIEWDAEIISEIQGELIAWKSLPGSEVHTEGRVEFVDAPGGGTKINVEMKYADDKGAIVKNIAAALNSTFEEQLKDELKSLKKTLESDDFTGNGNSHRSANPGSNDPENQQRLHEKRQQQQFQQQKQTNYNR